MANSALKSDKCYRVLKSLLKDGKAKFADESNMEKVFAKGYEIFEGQMPAAPQCCYAHHIDLCSFETFQVYYILLHSFIIECHFI